jgi:hypothetical protein
MIPEYIILCLIMSTLLYTFDMDMEDIFPIQNKDFKVRNDLLSELWIHVDLTGFSFSDAFARKTCKNTSII